MRDGVESKETKREKGQDEVGWPERKVSVVFSWFYVKKLSRSERKRSERATFCLGKVPSVRSTSGGEDTLEMEMSFTVWVAVALHDGVWENVQLDSGLLFVFSVSHCSGFSFSPPFLFFQFGMIAKYFLWLLITRAFGSCVASVCLRICFSKTVLCRHFYPLSAEFPSALSFLKD